MMDESLMLQFRSTSGPWLHFVATQSPVLSELERLARELLYRLFRVDGREIQSKELLLQALSSAMSFPPYFGQNWDALADCMRDLSWCRSDGYLLLFENGDVLWKCCPTDFKTFLEILDNVALVWREDSIPFHVLMTGTGELAKAAESVVGEGACDHKIT
jgi:Barstar (barnase inhibitor)